MKVLIVAGTPKAVQTLSGFLDGCNISTATDPMTVRAIDLNAFDTIFVSVPLSEESGVQLLSDIRKRTGAHLFAIVKEENAAALKKMTDGVYIITKPLFRGALTQAMRFCELNLENEARLRERVSVLEKKLNEQKKLCRAKLTLIQRGMTEEEAHRYIQQTAMNRRMTQAEVVVEILGESGDQ